jgi:hypothetical protein
MWGSWLVVPCVACVGHMISFRNQKPSPMQEARLAHVCGTLNEAAVTALEGQLWIELYISHFHCSSHGHSVGRTCSLPIVVNWGDCATRRSRSRSRLRSRSRHVHTRSYPGSIPGYWVKEGWNKIGAKMGGKSLISLLEEIRTPLVLSRYLFLPLNKVRT